MGFKLKSVFGAVSDPFTTAINRVVDDGSGKFGGFLNDLTGSTDAFNKSVQSEWDFWHANNAYNEAYNSPAAAMQRYKDAGLNPNLIYDKAGGNVTASGGSPSMSSSGSGALSSILGYLKLFGDLRQQDAMTQNINAQRNFYTTQADHMAAQNSLLSEQTREASARADMAEHNFNLLDGTDYILGEGFTSQIRRHVSGNGKFVPEDNIPEDYNPKRDTVVRDKMLPALGSNVVKRAKDWVPIFFGF